MLNLLFDSLQLQTCHDFIWLVVDDGSTDGTKDYLMSLAPRASFQIEYHFQPNQGKHVAHNFGVKLCNTPFIVCVDSDDTLIETAVEDLLKYIGGNRAIDERQVAGILAWKGYSKERKIGERPDTTSPSSLRDLYQLHHLTGDTLLVFKTEVIAQFPFPVVKGENFMRESLSYNQIDNQFVYLIMDKILYIADYYDDGLSKNATALEHQCPVGAAMFRWDEYINSNQLIPRVRNLIAYIYFNGLAGKSNESKERLGWKFYLFCIPARISKYHYKI